MTRIFIVFFAFLIISLTLGDDNNCLLWNNNSFIEQCCRTINDYEMVELTDGNVRYGKCIDTDKFDRCTAIKCIMEQEGKIIDGKIDSAAIESEMLKGKVKVTWAISVENAVKMCLVKMVNKECPEEYFLDCLDVAMFINCPKSDWNEINDCIQANRTLMNYCI